MAPISISRSYIGRAEEPANWETILQIFDSLFGEDVRSLPEYPEAIGWVTAHWHDVHGNTYKAESLEDVQEAYGTITRLDISSNRDDRPNVEFSYIPATMTAAMTITASNAQTIENALEVVRHEFPSRLFSPSVSHQTLERLPLKLKVLFLAANPKDRNLRLWLDEEVHDIKDKIRQARYRDYVDFDSEWAVRTSEVFQALNEHQPNVVHFSGHGSAANELILLDPEGKPKPVTKDAFKQMIGATSGHIRMVVLNTCHSRDLAEAAVEHIEAAIGMNASIGDEAARVFAAQFHSAVGFGLSVQRAFDQAVAQLMMEGIPEDKTPELFTRPGLDSDEIVLVRPLPGR